MFINNYSTITTTFIIQLIVYITNTNVQGNPIDDTVNQQLLSRIYNDESWNNQNEQEYRPRNAWMSESGESKNNRKDVNEDCKGSKTCSPTMDAPIKREMFVSRGWGAGGMPFNVLYMKNPKSNKSLRSSSSSIIAEPLRSQPMSPIQQRFISGGPNDGMNAGRSFIGETASQNYSQASTTTNNNNGNPNNNNNNHLRGRNSNSMLVPSRRHYSIIPQLFVSYGWGPIGK